ncbi:MAG TPA: hypothetical protein PLP61_08310 [Nocardioides sp.]|uniref:AMIN-like domain-containing (lipo)protein n=1 Tax=Nocardioides sp. TaxID=35761 RepID=UPI002BBE1F93|nr:hypothetical protein [Nocardioides sp.]HQR27025.1 hypothetical protein [Nocardioides sp.]
MKRILGLVLAALLGVALVPVAPAAAMPVWLTRGTAWAGSPEARFPQILDLRYAEHKRFDRVVIDVKGRLPGGRTHYRREFRYDPSDLKVPIRGGLEVVLRPAYVTDAQGHEVYEGPTLVRPGLPALKAVALTGTFEGQVNFAFGLAPRRTPYRVFLLHDPQRIVVDFKHTS